MSRVYFEGWYSGCYVKAEDWYKDNLIYVNVRIYGKSTAVDRPDVEKSFLLSMDDPDRAASYDHSIAAWLIGHKELRDSDGQMIPISVKLPETDLLLQAAARRLNSLY